MRHVLGKHTVWGVLGNSESYPIFSKAPPAAVEGVV